MNRVEQLKKSNPPPLQEEMPEVYQEILRSKPIKP